MRFDWDPEKNLKNRKKHGISFEDVVLVFSDRSAISIPDQEHSSTEDRWITIGLIPYGKIIVVVHTDQTENEKGEISIRIISARKATKKETSQYHKMSEGDKL
ncbi:MAG: BrnT family toxin [Leptospiraceae bacterium]|nr:BrnT family toxin [Leptospiraceae bacterium]MCK6380532.1 BrnT family toxin [Leptospiraceae bacterium]NUM42714.1 BrnT family toxin [Leptospiraceae bacterium]